MNPVRRLWVALVALVLVSTLGTLGYVLIEGMPVTDAVYLTVTTLTTVGYGDVAPRTTAGRMFTVGLILSGVGTALYLLTIGAQLVLEGRLREIFGRNVMQRRTDQLRGHVIVCGYGRFGKVVTEELRRGGAEVVVIDEDPAREEELRAIGVPYLIGSALADDVLERAGLARAHAIVIATPSDPANVFITLSARERNPSIRIHARGESEAGLRRLELAGATQALSAYHSGGLRMAASILRPSVVDFLELSMPGHHEEVALEEIRVEADGMVAGRTIADIEREHQRLRVVALKRDGEPLRIVPESSTRLAGGDLLIVIGEHDGLAGLGAAKSPTAAR